MCNASRISIDISNVKHLPNRHDINLKLKSTLILSKLPADNICGQLTVRRPQLSATNFCSAGLSPKQLLLWQALNCGKLW